MIIWRISNRWILCRFLALHMFGQGERADVNTSRIPPHSSITCCQQTLSAANRQQALKLEQTKESYLKGFYAKSKKATTCHDVRKQCGEQEQP